MKKLSKVILVLLVISVVLGVIIGFFTDDTSSKQSETKESYVGGEQTAYYVDDSEENLLDYIKYKKVNDINITWKYEKAERSDTEIGDRESGTMFIPSSWERDTESTSGDHDYVYVSKNVNEVGNSDIASLIVMDGNVDECTENFLKSIRDDVNAEQIKIDIEYWNESDTNVFTVVYPDYQQVLYLMYLQSKVEAGKVIQVALMTSNPDSIDKFRSYTIGA